MSTGCCRSSSSGCKASPRISVSGFRQLFSGATTVFRAASVRFRGKTLWQSMLGGCRVPLAGASSLSVVQPRPPDVQSRPSVGSRIANVDEIAGFSRSRAVWCLVFGKIANRSAISGRLDLQFCPGLHILRGFREFPTASTDALEVDR